MFVTPNVYLLVAEKKDACRPWQSFQHAMSLVKAILKNQQLVYMGAHGKNGPSTDFRYVNKDVMHNSNNYWINSNNYWICLQTTGMPDDGGHGHAFETSRERERL